WNPYGPNKPAGALALVADSAAFGVAERRRTDDGPVDSALCDETFLASLVPVIKRQDERDDEKSVVQAHASRTVANAQRSLTHQSLHTRAFHRVQDVGRAPGKD